MGSRTATTTRSLIFIAAISSSLAFAASYTSLDYPGATSTTLTGVNHFGQILGHYTLPDSTVHSFVFQNSAFEAIPDFPGSTSTFALGFNDDNLVVGYWSSGTGTGGFVYDRNIGSYTNAKVRYASSNIFFGINVYGETTGLAVVNGTTYAFEGLGNDYRFLQVPGASETVGLGITGFGSTPNRIVGQYVDGSSRSRGFLWVFNGFMGIDYPGATSTSAKGIYATVTNESIQIVGTYGGVLPLPRQVASHQAEIPNTVVHGFLFSGLSNWLSFDYPASGVTVTNPTSINEFGVIVGSYTADGVLHGFVREP